MKLSIGMLISNRIETVKKCFDSVKPLLDHGVAELICLDTITGTPGKISDGSAELARSYTNKVYVFPWIDDFSAARNTTLKYAEGDWYAFMDDDEWFEDVSEILEFFDSGDYLNYNSASFTIRNYKNNSGTEWADVRAVRFVKRSKELRFEGTVHEHYNFIKLPCKDFRCFAHHYGYAFENEEEKRVHRDRNLNLLRSELEKEPNDLRLHAQMALELASFDNAGALDFVEKTLHKFENKSEEPYYQWLETLRFPLYEALGKDAAIAEDELKNVIEKINLSETAQLVIHYELTRMWLLQDNRGKALSHVKEYFRLLDLLKNDREKRQLQNTADFEKYLSDDHVDEMKKYEEYCMEKESIWNDNGNICFGERKINLSGSPEEILKQLEEMSFDEFKIAVSGLIQETSSCFEDPVLNSAIEYFEKKDQIEYCFLLYKMSEAEIKRAVEKGANGKAIFELFNECICTERKMYELLYKPFVFTEKGLRWMDEELRYNDILYRFIAAGAKDLKSTLDAAKLRPDMANVIKVWLGALG